MNGLEKWSHKHSHPPSLVDQGLLSQLVGFGVMLTELIIFMGALQLTWLWLTPLTRWVCEQWEFGLLINFIELGWSFQFGGIGDSHSVSWHQYSLWIWEGGTFHIPLSETKIYFLEKFQMNFCKKISLQWHGAHDTKAVYNIYFITLVFIFLWLILALVRSLLIKKTNFFIKNFQWLP